MLVCVFLYCLCTRDRGCSAHPVFPASLLGWHCAPFDLRGGMLQQNSGAMRGENADVCPCYCRPCERRDPYTVPPRFPHCGECSLSQAKPGVMGPGCRRDDGWIWSGANDEPPHALQLTLRPPDLRPPVEHLRQQLPIR